MSAMDLHGSGGDLPVSASNPVPVTIISGGGGGGSTPTGTAGSPNASVVTVQGIGSGTALTVAGQVAVGSPPTNPPLSVSGVDGSGNKQHLLTDTSGRQIVSIQPASVSAMTTPSVTTTSAQVLAARTGRRRLSFQNTGAGTVTLLFGTGTAVVGAGIVLASGGAAGSQGGAWEEPAHECWAGAVQAIGAATSTLTIIEG